MTLALAALLLAAPCEHPALGTLSPGRQAAACELLARPAGPTADRAALQAVYQRPGFERARERNSGALQALLAQLEAWLERLFETSGAETYSNVTRVVVLFLAALVGLFAALRFASRRRAAAAAATAGASTPAPLVLDSPAAHLERARAALAADPRAAIREGLLALLSHLERERLARPDRVKTNQELARELPGRGASPALAEAVARLVGWYDLAFYSLEPVAEDAARRFIDEVAGLARPETTP
ncbi:MAG: DUF4129 domain-containing protein [Myxococcota bacterium]